MQKFLDRFTWGGKNRLIYTFGAMTLFFMLFEGMVSYILPITITGQGLSKTMLGIILAAAAVSGAFFDFAIYKIFKEAHYRRLFFAMFASSALYLFLVWIANSFLLFLAAMAIWGFFYDLKSFGTIDFVSRYSKKKEVAGNFGIIQTFQAIGYLLAPLIAGFLIVDYLGWQPFAAAATFLLIAAFFLALLFFEARKSREFLPQHERHFGKGFLHELSGWRKTGAALLPVFLLGSFATIIDSFYMALGPLVAESLPLEPFDGIFMFAYYLPPLLIGGLVGAIASRFGERNSALFGLLFGAAIISSFAFISSSFAIIAAVFLSACFTGLVIPLVQSSYAHAIRAAPKSKKEIQELGDFASNFGYIIGPIAAGILADSLGTLAAFSALGMMGVVFALLLFFLMPGKMKNKR